MRRLRNGLMQSPANMAQDVTVSLMLPVARAASSAPSQDAITVKAFVFVKPGSGDARRAGAGEANLSLWDAPSSKWQPGQSLVEGGWNQKGGAAVTDASGVAELKVAVTDGWVRIMATHAKSGVQVATAIQVKGNYYVPETIQAAQLIRTGQEMPATFQQPMGLDDYSRAMWAGNDVIDRGV